MIRCNLQQRTQTTLTRCFDLWTRVVVNYNKRVCVLSVLVYIALCKELYSIQLRYNIGFSLTLYESMGERMVIWTPKGNRSQINFEKSLDSKWQAIVEIAAEDDGAGSVQTQFLTREEILEQYAFGFWFDIIMQAKPQPDNNRPSLITLDSVKEMIEFESFFLNLSMPVPDPSLTDHAELKVSQVCENREMVDENTKKQIEGGCRLYRDDPAYQQYLHYCDMIEPAKWCTTTPRLLDFFYDRLTESWNLERYDTDLDVIAKVQSGKGDILSDKTRSVWVKDNYGATRPREVNQDKVTYRNDLYSAEYMIYQMDLGWLPKAEGFNLQWFTDLHEHVQNEAQKWSESSELLQVYIYSVKVWEREAMKEVVGDFNLIIAAILLIFVYSNVVLGSCSPVHLRTASASIGIGCVILSVMAGYGMAFLIGQKFSQAHNILPFMLIGLGVDDMFVIVNCIDQTSTHLTPNQRFKEGFRHAGPSITVTSLTDAIAFFLGALTSLPALRSFCIFAGLCVITLYFSFITIFASWYIYDLRRMHERKTDCCNLCCCKENSIVCCRGRFLSQRQRQFSMNESEQTRDPKIDLLSTDDGQEYYSRIEKVFTKYFAPCVISNKGRISVIFLLSLGLTAASIGIYLLESHFTVEFFIKKGSITEQYFKIFNKQFDFGWYSYIYHEGADTDWASEEVQLQLIALDDLLERCFLCERQWFVFNTHESPYLAYLKWIQEGKCSLVPEITSPFQKTIPEQAFYPCLDEFMVKPEQNVAFADGIWEDGAQNLDEAAKAAKVRTVHPRGKLIGFFGRIKTVKIKNASVDGTAFLTDLRYILDNYGVADTYDNNPKNFDYESYFKMRQEFNLCISLSIVAVLVVVLLVTANVIATVLVALMVVFTDVLLLGSIHWWGLTFNSIVVLNVILAVGTSVDYSTHIAYGYLTAAIPDELKASPKSAVRAYKVKQALRSMGPSVFHGAFSTFTAIALTAPSRTYVFIVFFRLWSTILLFGMVNGLVTLPVILSFVGPLNNQTAEDSSTQVSDDSDPVKTDKKSAQSAFKSRSFAVKAEQTKQTEVLGESHLPVLQPHGQQEIKKQESVMGFQINEHEIDQTVSNSERPADKDEAEMSSVESYRNTPQEMGAVSKSAKRS